MKKGLFSGWKEVFSFTFKQGCTGKYKSVTGIIGIILLAGFMAISIIMAMVQKKDAESINPIEKVYIVDDSDLAVLYLDAFEEMFGEDFPTVTFEKSTDDVKTLAEKLGKESTKDIILHVTHEEGATVGEGSYMLTMVLPNNTEISESNAQDLNNALGICMEQSKLLSSGISPLKLQFVMSGVNVSYIDAGEAEKSVGEEMVTMLFPMLVMFLLYFMVLIYGQSMGNIVSVEKTSKLMEMMLTLTKPYGLITGKLLATITTALMQFLIWIACMIGGFIGGHYVALEIYPEYNNLLIEIFKLLQNQDGSSAFTVGAIAIAIVTICISFIFYCTLAATFASFASKAEELQQTMAFYQFTMVVAFMGSYMLPVLKESKAINNVLRLFPPTGAFLLPGDLVVGRCSMGMGLLSLGILLAATVALILVSGKVYKNQIFYKGKSLKERFSRRKK